MNKEIVDLLDVWHGSNYDNKVDGRYLTLAHIRPFLDELADEIEVEKIGASFEGQPIFGLKWGDGSTKILMWTQMHGNESTGTRALFDFLKLIDQPGELKEMVESIKRSCSITMIPILNPDGAKRYTRVSAQQIDLNRDVVDKRAPESQLLQSVLKDINPHYCFNLHDQRTLFSVGRPPKPATISFLAPSVDESREVTEGRKETMRVVVAMNNCIRHTIEGQIGRYTDEFYPTATGDNFEKMGHHTILIESGHAVGDYSRDLARKATFMSIMAGLNYIASRESVKIDYKAYFEIPNNEKNYRDIIIEGVTYRDEVCDISFQFEEKLVEGVLNFNPLMEEKGSLEHLQADQRVDGRDLEFDSKISAEKWVKNKFN